MAPEESCQVEASVVKLPNDGLWVRIGRMNSDCLSNARFLLIAFAIAVAQPSLSLAEESVDFSRDVLPLLADRCFHCHGPDAEQRQAALRLDQRESAVEQTGVVVPAEPDQSELLYRVTVDDPDLLMPPPESHRKPLSKAEVAILRRWIAEGAVWGKHWAFEPPKKPEITASADNPIDVFVQRRLEKEGLQLSPEADKRTQIRRLTLDLTGLPPTIQEVDAFLSDQWAGAYERLVDRLLASKRYGERMAWPWLDAARYADTSGYQGDPTRSMWPWRDWVVDAFNQNMPFDQFTVEQLAGDLLDDATAEQRLATGFNRNHMHNGEGGRIPEETRVENVFDRAETTGTVWLGLTLQCARCHDHKFDPTSNLDYFAFYAFFNQTSESGKGNGGPAVPPFMEYFPRRGIQHGDETAETVKVMVMDTLPEPRKTLVLIKGVYNNVTDQEVAANVPGMLPPLPDKKPGEPYSRLDLANWMVSPENPLTARVTVNRFWQMLFGRGIVSTPSDFGLQGSQPTHPELLDWLAVEFVESGWDVKKLLRLMVTSQTYRQSSHVTKDLHQRDPENALYARARRYRMPSWMLRDAALASSGLLDAQLGGPPVNPYQPDGIWSEATFGKIKYQQDSGEDLYRRSLYTFWRRIVGPSIFFDAAKRQTCEVSMHLTNTPLHALTTLNDVTYVEAARVFAEQLIRRQHSDRERIFEAFYALTTRPPEPRELELLEKRLASAIDAFRDAPEQAEALLTLGEATRDESIEAAQHAALTVVINTIMNLDETLVKP